MRAIIVASGPSANGFKPVDGVFTIAVNGVADWIERADAWFSLDASLANQRRLTDRRLKDCIYVTCGPRWPYGANRHFTRVTASTSIPSREPTGSPLWWFWRLGCVAGINKDDGCINTGNSAWGALGLAWHLGFREVALIGVDANKTARCEGGYSNSLNHLPMLFASAVDSFDRIVCLGEMEAKGIPKMTLEKWL